MDKSAVLQQQITQVEEFARKMKSARAPDSRDRVYQEWKSYYHKLCYTSTNEDVSRFIQSILRSRIDSGTGQNFKVSNSATLASADSLRVFLLDQLEIVDKTAARNMARVIIERRDNQSEYAIAMRILARDKSNEVSKGEIDSAFRMMMQKPDWRMQPSNGFLESFDIAVANATPAKMAELISLDSARSNLSTEVSTKIEHACKLSLDRIMLSKPDVALDAIRYAPAGMEGLSKHFICTVMIRANVTTAKGAAAVRDFLRNPAIDQSHKNYVLSHFPNGNYNVGSRMVSKSEIDTAHNIYRIYRESYTALQRMKASGEIEAAHADRLLANVAEYFPKE